MGMKNRFQEAIQNVQRQRHLARRSVAMVLVLAMLTAMSVSWRLHQDGIALAADDTRYYCGKEEHKHTDDCYIEGTEPICGYEEGEIIEETMDLADDAGDGDSSAADRDEAGRRTLEVLRKRYGNRIEDCSALYKGFKDLNEYLQNRDGAVG